MNIVQCTYTHCTTHQLAGLYSSINLCVGYFFNSGKTTLPYGGSGNFLQFVWPYEKGDKQLKFFSLLSRCTVLFPLTGFKFPLKFLGPMVVCITILFKVHGISFVEKTPFLFHCPCHTDAVSISCWTHSRTNRQTDRHTHLPTIRLSLPLLFLLLVYIHASFSHFKPAYNMTITSFIILRTSYPVVEIILGRLLGNVHDGFTSTCVYRWYALVANQPLP